MAYVADAHSFIDLAPASEDGIQLSRLEHAELNQESHWSYIVPSVTPTPSMAAISSTAAPAYSGTSSTYLLSSDFEFFENEFEAKTPCYGVVGLAQFYRIYMQSRGKEKRMMEQ